MAAPSFFNMLKWKSTKRGVPTLELKSRDVISFRRNVFTVRGKLVGRVLQVLIDRVVVLKPTYNFHRLLGVRDQARAVMPLGGKNVQGDFLEQDMLDTLWETPKNEALQTARLAIALAHPDKRHDVSCLLCARVASNIWTAWG